MNTHDKIELPEHDCLYESTNEQGYIDLEPAYRKSTVLRLLEADRQRRGEPVSDAMLSLLRDARHRIANLSRSSVPFHDPLDGPVLRRLDAAIASAAAPQPADPDEERLAMEAVMESVDPATWPGLTAAQRCALGRFAKPQPAEPVKALVEDQEPLGEDFQQVLDDNRWDLYVKDSETVKVPSDLASRLRAADRLLLEQGKFSDVRALLREAADVIARYGSSQPAANVIPVPTTKTEYIALLDMAIELGKKLNIAWEDAIKASTPVVQESQQVDDAAVSAIQFALQADEGLAWLRCWNEGDFDACRKWWPDAPEECFIGADPLHPGTKAALSAAPVAQEPVAVPTWDDLQALAIKHGAWVPGYGPFATELLATYGAAPKDQPHWVMNWLNAMNACRSSGGVAPVAARAEKGE